MHTMRLPPEIEKRLDALAKKTGRTKSSLAREAILRHIEDIEDEYLAKHRLKRGGRRVTLKALERDDPFASFSEWSSVADKKAFDGRVRREKNRDCRS